MNDFAQNHTVVFQDEPLKFSVSTMPDIREKFKFRLEVLKESKHYPFEDIGFNLDEWINWLFRTGDTIEESAKILDEEYSKLLLIHMEKRK